MKIALIFDSKYYSSNINERKGWKAESQNKETRNPY